jgi:hypothetical protein
MFVEQPFKGLCKINNDPMKDYYKISIYQFPKILITGIKNEKSFEYTHRKMCKNSKFLIKLFAICMLFGCNT